MTAADTHSAAPMRLAHYPVTFLAIGMGMIGATLAIRSAERAFLFMNTVSTVVLILSVAYVFALVVAKQVAKFRKMPFALSWWALSFPLAALTIASFGYAEAAGSASHRLISAGLLALLGAVVVGLILRTGLAIRDGSICVPE